MRHSPFWLTATAVLVAAFLGAGLWYYYQLSTRIVWSMVNLSDDDASSDAHLLELPDGQTVLIDAGFGESARRILIPYLEQRRIDRIDLLIVTRAHRNHYGGIVPLLEWSGGVGRVYFNLPAKSFCRTRSGCDYADLTGTRELVERSGTALHPLSTDELLYHNDEHDIILEVVYAAGGPAADDPYATGGTGALIRLIYGDTTVLFAADVNGHTGDRLVDGHFFINSTLLTAPLDDDGQEASERFLERVDPEAILVSNGARQWHGRSGDRIRRFSVNRGVDTYVTGIHGNVVVALEHDGFSVTTERTPVEQ